MTSRRCLMCAVAALIALLAIPLAAKGKAKAITSLPISINPVPSHPTGASCDIFPPWQDANLNTTVTWSTTDGANTYTVTFTNGSPFSTSTIGPITNVNSGSATITVDPSSVCGPNGCYYPYTITKNSGTTCMGTAPDNSFGLHVKPISTKAR
jgi:hypothetical protein